MTGMADVWRRAQPARDTCWPLGETLWQSHAKYSHARDARWQQAVQNGAQGRGKWAALFDDNTRHCCSCDP